MVTIMLARERRRGVPPPPGHLSPAAELAWRLANLSSRPLEMIAASAIKQREQREQREHREHREQREQREQR
jgi:hypothetical protein